MLVRFRGSRAGPYANRTWLLLGVQIRPLLKNSKLLSMVLHSVTGFAPLFACLDIAGQERSGTGLNAACYLRGQR